MTRQITITHDRVRCDCGFEDKSFDKVILARQHNTRAHAGNYKIYDQEEECTRSQLTGELMR